MIHVENNYFNDPYEIRARVIKNQENFLTDTNFLWPGRRWINGVDENIINQVLSTIRSITEEKSFKDYNFHYQSIDKKYFKGGIHRDHSKYTCLIFLSPQPHKKSGLEIYQRKTDQEVLSKGDLTSPKKEFIMSEKTLWDKIKYSNKMKKYENFFGEPVIINNQFNRLVIFDSKLFHRAQDYFGDSISNSRLTIIGFVS